ncbi:hypothetical protein D3C86_1015360 [compost metagenome]
MSGWLNHEKAAKTKNWNQTSSIIFPGTVTNHDFQNSPFRRAIGLTSARASDTGSKAGKPVVIIEQRLAARVEIAVVRGDWLAIGLHLRRVLTMRFVGHQRHAVANHQIRRIGAVATPEGTGVIAEASIQALNSRASRIARLG